MVKIWGVNPNFTFNLRLSLLMLCTGYAAKTHLYPVFL